MSSKRPPPKPKQQKGPARRRTCDICGCVVYGDEAQWQIHTAGIQHRRNQASCRLFGEPGHLVVSAFEPDGAQQLTAAAAAVQPPAAIAAAGGRGRQGQTRTPHQQHQQQQRQGVQSNLQQQLRRLQNQVQKHLAAQVGINKLYRTAVEQFDLSSMQQAYDGLVAALAQQQQQQVQNAPTLQQPPQQQQQQEQQQHDGHYHPQPQQQQQPPPLLPQQQQQQQQQEQHQLPLQQQQQQQQQQRQPVFKVGVQQPATAAVLPLLEPHITRLTMTVPYQTYGHAAAATAAAVATFLSSLAHNRRLTHLALQFECRDYQSLVGQNAGCFMKVNRELWGAVMRVLREALEYNCTLESFTLATFPAQLDASDVVDLQTTLLTGRARMRMALLMATHSVVGVNSPLHRLPPDVFSRLLDAAVPRTPCVLLLELPAQLQDSSSSSSSSDDDDSSSDSSSDGSSSEEEDDSSDIDSKIDSNSE